MKLILAAAFCVTGLAARADGALAPDTAWIGHCTTLGARFYDTPQCARIRSDPAVACAMARGTDAGCPARVRWGHAPMGCQRLVATCPTPPELPD